MGWLPYEWVDVLLFGQISMETVDTVVSTLPPHWSGSLALENLSQSPGHPTLTHLPTRESEKVQIE